MKTMIAMMPLAMAGVALSGWGSGGVTAEPQPIRWSVEAAHPGTRRVELHGSGVNASIDPASEAQLAELGPRLVAAREQPVRFRLSGEPGTLDCQGSAGRGRGQGDCRFRADESFARALAQRGIAARPRDMLPLLLVGATLARVDGLAAEGLRPRDADALVAVCALNVDGAFVAILAREGLRPRTLDQAVSARALGIDVAWLRELVGVGLHPSGLDQAIELKAVGVDAAYARAITAVLTETRPARPEAILQ